MRLVFLELYFVLHMKRTPFTRKSNNFNNTEENEQQRNSPAIPRLFCRPWSYRSQKFLIDSGSRSHLALRECGNEPVQRCFSGPRATFIRDGSQQPKVCSSRRQTQRSVQC